MNNEQAFPTQLHGGDGMTLRDYFAAKAMQGMLSENSGVRCPTDELVDFAYKIADAMMKARDA